MEVIKGGAAVEQSDEGFLLRKILGTLLIATGTSLGLAIALVIYYLLMDQLDLPILRRLLPGSLEARSITTLQGGRLELPPALFISSSYVVVLMLMAIIASIAKGFLSAGARLLQPDMENLIKKLLRQRPK